MTESPANRPLVFVVDDNADVRAALTVLLESVGLTCKAYSSTKEFFDSMLTLQATAYCLILDVGIGLARIAVEAPGE